MDGSTNKRIFQVVATSIMGHKRRLPLLRFNCVQGLPWAILYHAIDIEDEFSCLTDADAAYIGLSQGTQLQSKRVILTIKLATRLSKCLILTHVQLNDIMSQFLFPLAKLFFYVGQHCTKSSGPANGMKWRSATHWSISG